MKNIFYILFFCFYVNGFSQEFIVLRKAQRDSLVNILLPQFQNYMNHSPIGKIGLDPVMLADSSHYILQQDLLYKPEWQPLYNAFFQAGYIQKLVVRAVGDSEFVKTKNPWE